ncbi:MAG: type II-A CRISPR-associated protein Csn2 [Bacilli bacterium]|jgi:CRISPR-associated protein Csn2
MKVIKYKDIDQDICLSKTEFFNLVIESPIFYRQYLQGLKNQLDNKDPFLLEYENDKEIELSSDAFLVSNPLEITIDEKKMNTAIQKEIAGKITISQKEDFEKLQKEINDYIESISLDYPLPVSFDMDFSLLTLLKSISLQTSDDFPNFLEYLINQIKKISFVLKYKTFFIVNLHDYLSNEEMISFIKEMDSLEIGCVLLSSHLPLSKLPNEYIIRIDNDLAELHIESDSRKN